MASTTALPPPTCTARQEAGQLHLLAVVTTRPVPVGSSAGCFAARPVPAGSSAAVYFKACAGQFICRLFACLLTFAMPCLRPTSILPHSVLHSPAPCSLPCAPGSPCKLQGLPCWQLQHGPAVAARAPIFDFSCFFSLQSPLILGQGIV